MQILSLRPLQEFWEQYRDAEVPLRTWYKITLGAKWESFAELRATFRSADAVGDKRVIFDIGGNKYRIVARVVYGPYYRLMIKFVGTHAQYNNVNPETV